MRKHANMKLRIVIPAVVALVFASMSHAQQQPSKRPGELQVFLLDGKHLQAVRDRVGRGDKTLDSALAALRRDAQAALKADSYSVVDKKSTPPSGDKHDYMTLAPYFWPNPETPDGLPYIRRDGEYNPEVEKLPDRIVMNKMAADASTLALAYYFTGEEKYAAKASELLRAWFLDPATRMNPNLEYGQAIRGVNTGRGIGIIETSVLAEMLDYVGLLADSTAWTPADQRGLEKWFAEYLKWLQDSPHGRKESAAKNNHGTFYDLQVARFALFTGNEKLAVEMLREVGPKRIAVQIEPDGRQPLELSRTKALGYSLANLRGLILLARLAEKVQVDLWNYRTADGRCIPKALDYVLPYALGEEKWPYKQITGWSAQAAHSLLRWAALKYPDRRYRMLCSKLPAVDPENRDILLLPKQKE
jgi:hypothetical protein